MPVDIQKDEEKGLYYVQKEEKRLYFRKSTPARKIQKYYRALSMEQDLSLIHIYPIELKEALQKAFAEQSYKVKFMNEPDINTHLRITLGRCLLYTSI